MRVLILSSFVICLFVGGPSHGAIPSHPKSRAEAVRAGGRSELRRLRILAFDANQTVDVRWRSLLTLAMVGGKDVMPELEAALKSSDWFMRDAGLLALRKVDPKSAVRWSRLLLSDPALVVRTSAVSTLRQLGDSSSRELLWEKLNAPQNFRGSQSLWVRHHIVQALAEGATKGEEGKFLKILGDSDARLHRPAGQALVKITGHQAPQSKLSDRRYWSDRITQ